MIATQVINDFASVRSMAVISAGLLLWLKVSAGSAASLGQNSSVQFAVTDPRAEITESLSLDLVLKIRPSADAQGRRYGWDIAVIDRRLGDYPNFLYSCLCGHGPQPTDLYAWHFREMLYPPKRVLPVYGYPFEIRVECKDCRVDGNTATDIQIYLGSCRSDMATAPEV
jgi:hypothetical protein